MNSCRSNLISSSISEYEDLPLCRSVLVVLCSKNSDHYQTIYKPVRSECSSVRCIGGEHQME